MSCEYCEEQNGDCIEDFGYNDFYSCMALNNLDAEKYGGYDSVKNQVNIEECKHFLCEGCKVREKIKYIQESYCDEFKTLQQNIMYEFENELDQKFRRKQINPNMKIHLFTRYLDKDMKIICTKWEGPEELKGEVL